MKNFSHRLRAARTMRGFSMQELVSRLEGNLSKQAISRYETGVMAPTRDNLRLLCQALDVRPDYFDRDIQVSLEQVAFRKMVKLSSKSEQMIKFQAADYLERYLELEEILEQATTWSKLSFPAHSFHDVETAANALRDLWDLGEGPLSNTVELLEDNGIKVLEIEADPSFSGLSGWLGEQGTPFIVLNRHADIPADRKRFTALHELGHLLLDVGEVPEKTVETRCNQFAGAMLIPQKQLEQELGRFRHTIHLKELQLLKLQYGMSMQGILFRAKDLGIISEYQFKTEMKSFNRLGIRKVEPAQYHGLEKPYRFLQLLCRAIAEEYITTSKAATLYNMKVAEFMDEINNLS
jgi:Zn-dependent peptidase ImmA (M78 family)/transcriptional regulator with XRE-family HTH domain